jgi:hypothetical protein
LVLVLEWGVVGSSHVEGVEFVPVRHNIAGVAEDSEDPDIPIREAEYILVVGTQEVEDNLDSVGIVEVEYTPHYIAV